jgi:C1A family cysteine protease
MFTQREAKMETVHNCKGWRPDKPDHRDFKYCVPRHLAVALPAAVDLRPNCPPIWDQGNIGSCTAHAISGALQYDAIKNKQDDADIVRSRLFIYYNERVIEGTVHTDAGAEIRDGIKSVASQGACDEKLWWYNTEKFAAKPSAKCYTNAKQYEALSYMRVTQTANDMKACLASGYPIVLGVTVYSSFMTDEAAATGMIPMPSATESVEGGHAIDIVGYNTAKRLFTFRNSWGTSWGDKGYGYFPESYLINPNLCDDLWTIRAVS